MAKGETISLDWQWTERQWEAMNEPARYLLWGGSKGAGKTVMLCRWAALQCLNIKGNRGFLGRQRSVDFYNTTLETFRKFVDSRVYEINEQRKRIYFPASKSEIFYGGMDDEKTIAKFNSAEFGFIGIDQAEEVGQDTFALLCGTLRYLLPNGKRPQYQIRMTANPAQCWLVQKFIQTPESGYKFIPALPSDNPFLPADYIENLKRAFAHRPELVQAYVYGSWDVMAGSDIVIKPGWVNDAIDRVLHEQDTRRVIVCDPSRFGDDETVIYALEGTKIIDQDIYGQKSLMETAGNLIAMKNKHRAKLIIVDGIGMGGGICDRLRELRENVLEINSAATPTTDDAKQKYSNLRAQMTWEAAEMFAKGIVTLPKDDGRLLNQLRNIKYKISSTGKIQIEAKEDIKQRSSGESPDRADAYIMGLHGLQYVPVVQRDFNRVAVMPTRHESYGWSQQRDYAYA